MTPHGKQWQQVVMEGRRRIALEQKKIEEELMALWANSPPQQPTKVKESSHQQAPTTMDVDFLDGLDVDKLLADDVEETGNGNSNTNQQGTEANDSGMPSTTANDDE